MKKRHTEIADMIVDGLEDFATSLKEGVDIAQAYNCHKVLLELEPTPYDPDVVRRTRQVLRASQAIFAQFLGVSVQAVRAWEQGSKEPSDIACRFMDEIRSNPDYWRDRLRRLVRPKTAEA